VNRVLAIGLALTAMLGVACGSGDAGARLVAPTRVPTGLVPATLEGNLTLNEYLPARKAFAHSGAASLVADGRVWAIRRGQTLVGTLQVSAVKPDVKLTKGSDRQAILDGVMSGTSYQTLEVGDLKVVASTAADRSLYLWFGPGLFEVLQVKGTKVDPDSVAGDMIAFQQSTGVLR
jgi:hypothetical protein